MLKLHVELVSFLHRRPSKFAVQQVVHTAHFITRSMQIIANCPPYCSLQ